MGRPAKKSLAAMTNLVLYLQTRQDTNLFNFLMKQKTYIQSIDPDVIIIAAAKVGGIYANNTQRVEFLIENLKN